ncbi:hypothetical protein POR16_15015 [Pseudomonas coronafaciens pv. oryzae str. 1_6]|nr:hypothetical protein POR16_15015 [Pseudomonas coronafaciens pv. oryzae str. 1_6]
MSGIAVAHPQISCIASLLWRSAATLDLLLLFVAIPATIFCICPVMVRFNLVYLEKRAGCDTITPANDDELQVVMDVIKRLYIPTYRSFFECFVELTITRFCPMVCVPKSNGRMK